MAGAASTPLGLPRSRMLKQRRDFVRVRRFGKRVAAAGLVANWLRQSPGAPARLGVVTGRKLGSAVVRSRARRLLREAFRRHQRELAQPLDLVLVARSGITHMRFGDVERELMGILRRAGLLQPGS